MSRILIIEPNLVRANCYMEVLESAGWLVDWMDSVSRAVELMATPAGRAISIVLVGPKLLPAGGEFPPELFRGGEPGKRPKVMALRSQAVEGLLRDKNRVGVALQISFHPE